MSDNRPAVLVMAKAPRPGQVKTRLASLLGDEGCAALQALMISHSSALAAAAAPGACFVAFDPPDAHAAVAPLTPPDVTLIAQRGANLGERLAAATGEVFASGSGPLVVIGTDAPTLTAEDLHGAWDALGGGHDAVIGPACDGGYYLIGLSRPLPALFAIDPALWGGRHVLAATMGAARRHGIDMALLAVRRDLDTPADAQALLADPLLPPSMARLLAAST